VEELTQIRPSVVLALGKIGFDAYLRALVTQGLLPRRHRFRFRHGAKYRLPGDLPVLFAAFHPSRQNTQTGRLTPSMYRRVFRRIQRELSRLKA
jgi:uracil-DNA glycosylase